MQGGQRISGIALRTDDCALESVAALFITGSFPAICTGDPSGNAETRRRCAKKVLCILAELPPRGPGTAKASRGFNRHHRGEVAASSGGRPTLVANDLVSHPSGKNAKLSDKRATSHRGSKQPLGQVCISSSDVRVVASI